MELVGVRPPLDVLVLDRPEALGVCPVPAQRALVPLRVSLVRIVVEDHHGVTIGTALCFPPHGCVPLGGLRFAQGFLLSQQDGGAASSRHLLREVEPRERLGHACGARVDAREYNRPAAWEFTRTRTTIPKP